MARLDDAVRRILRVKMRAGLFEAGLPSGRPLAGREDVVGHEKHRALAREAVRRSLVLLKNNDALLPLAPDSNVLVAGEAAHDVARQSGGWTLTWQGTGNEPADFPGATSIFEGIRAAVEAGGGRAVHSDDGGWNQETFAEGAPPDVAIVAFGEEPYAEWYGDRPGIEYQRGNKTDLALLRRLKSQNIPVAAVFISGRPLWVNAEINASDAFVVAWLPGSEGAGVADMLFRSAAGDVVHDFTGRLSFSWPRFPYQRVLTADAGSYEPLFPYGYGLSYQDDVMLADDLPENAVYPPGEADETWLFVARPVPPWQLRLQDERSGAPTVAGAERASGGAANVTMEPVDWSFEEDGRRFAWQGEGGGSVAFTADTEQDLTAYAGHRAALAMAVRVDEAPTTEVFAAMECGAGCAASVSVGDVLASMPSGDWRTLAIDLQCFAEAGADLSRVSSALVLSTRGRLGVSLADVKIVPGAAGKADVRCSREG